MPRNPLATHPPWRQLTIISLLLPTVIVAAVLAFAWPVARVAPRSLPVGFVGTGAAARGALAGLERAQPGAFDVHLYADGARARSAIRDRSVYGAFVIDGSGVTVLEASAASPTVAQLLSGVGQQLDRRVAPTAGPKIVDVVPAPSEDPRGLVLSSALLPLTICSIIIAAAIALLIGLRPAWRQVVALGVVSGLAGLGAYLIAEPFLGALPGEHLATWAALTLTLLAMGSTAAGLIALLGSAGLGLSAVLMVFVGNPFSGVSSAPQLLPRAVDRIGQWLPPGAGAGLLRSTAYFHGNGAAGHLAVLLLWTAFGLAAVVVGHHTWTGFAARRADADGTGDRSGAHAAA